MLSGLGPRYITCNPRPDAASLPPALAVIEENAVKIQIREKTAEKLRKVKISPLVCGAKKYLPAKEHMPPFMSTNGKHGRFLPVKKKIRCLQQFGRFSRVMLQGNERKVRKSVSNMQDTELARPGYFGEIRVFVPFIGSMSLTSQHSTAFRGWKYQRRIS